MGDARQATSPAVTVGLFEEFGWHCRRMAGLTLWFKGHLTGGQTPEGLAARIAVLGHDAGAAEAAGLLSEIHGHFALIAEAQGFTLAAVDRIRSIPLIWGEGPAGPLIDQDGGRLERALRLTPADADPDAVLAVGLSGFTIGDDTLHPGVRQIGPGSFVIFRAAAAPVRGRYHRFEPWRPVAAERGALKAALKELLRNTFVRLIESADGRPIAVPLSAGLDSRLIASALKVLGAEKILLFAYGRAGNHEAEASQAIAQRLGLPWRFVPYDVPRLRALFTSERHRRYVTSADSLTGVFFPQDYHALTVLLAEGYLPANAVIVNGQSGDFITGNHVPAALAEVPHGLAPAAREARIVDALLAKHYKQWGHLRTPANLARVAARLKREIAAFGGLPATPQGDHGLYEACEFQDRQSKYVVNGQRVYEFLGLDWRLPLWDDSWLDFWARVPLELKVRQNLYRQVLMEENWGDVWRDIPINAKRVRPGWMVPIRAALKALHAPLGRARWHDFERRYLTYWTSLNSVHALVRYRDVALDGRRPYSGVSVHIERYLADKGLTLDGSRRAAGAD
jgi:asparagine synthase (glutamine-hydrolysing)